LMMENVRSVAMILAPYTVKGFQPRKGRAAYRGPSQRGQVRGRNGAQIGAVKPTMNSRLLSRSST